MGIANTTTHTITIKIPIIKKRKITPVTVYDPIAGKQVPGTNEQNPIYCYEKKNNRAKTNGRRNKLRNDSLDLCMGNLKLDTYVTQLY